MSHVTCQLFVLHYEQFSLSLPMSFNTLHVLFECLCKRLGEHTKEFHFRVGFEVELSRGVVMVFVFDRFVVVCRFPTDKRLRPWAADECLEMIHRVEQCKGGFSELVVGSLPAGRQVGSWSN